MRPFGLVEQFLFQLNVIAHFIVIFLPSPYANQGLSFRQLRASALSMWERTSCVMKRDTFSSNHLLVLLKLIGCRETKRFQFLQLKSMPSPSRGTTSVRHPDSGHSSILPFQQLAEFQVHRRIDVPEVQNSDPLNGGLRG
jgi:hypothetical protein